MVVRACIVAGRAVSLESEDIGITSVVVSMDSGTIVVSDVRSIL